MITMLTGDCRDVLRTLPDASVHCVVTSPPYWGLRDYGTAIWQGGDVGCSHKQYRDGAFSADGGMPGGRSRDGAAGLTRNACHCGAIRIDAQLGLEPDFNAYVANMVAVFREVRRVLRDDGTLWLNLGDSYAANGIKSNNNGTGKSGLNCLKPGYIPPYHQQDVGAKIKQEIPIGLKPKDLCGIPWRVAFALQADGWYLRQDIIWSKPNPMPESITDRCTKAHEYLFLLSKRERYYFDQEAIRETPKPWVNGNVRMPEMDGYRSLKEGYKERGPQREKQYEEIKGANKRSVWEVTTQPFSEAHFATFPPALIEPCIKAGTSERGCCGKCGKPWVRQQQRTGPDGSLVVVAASERHARLADGTPLMGDNRFDIGVRGSFNATRGTLTKETVGWSPSCACAADPVPCTVLDPFAGAGTTGLVADRLQRNAVLIELNPTYAAMGERRIVGDAPLFVEVAP